MVKSDLQIKRSDFRKSLGTAHDFQKISEYLCAFACYLETVGVFARAKPPFQIQSRPFADITLRKPRVLPRNDYIVPFGDLRQRRAVAFVGGQRKIGNRHILLRETEFRVAAYVAEKYHFVYRHRLSILGFKLLKTHSKSTLQKCEALRVRPVRS